MKKRDYITELMYPNKIKLDEFINKIQDSLDIFIKNMKDIEFDEYKYIEQWMEIYCLWMEIH